MNLYCTKATFRRARQFSRYDKSGSYSNNRYSRAKQRRPFLGTIKSRLRVFSRGSTILPAYRGYRVFVHNGSEFYPLIIDLPMIGKTFGEFAFSKQRGSHIHRENRQVAKKRRQAKEIKPRKKIKLKDRLRQKARMKKKQKEKSQAKKKAKFGQFAKSKTKGKTKRKGQRGRK